MTCSMSISLPPVVRNRCNSKRRGELEGTRQTHDRQQFSLQSIHQCGTVEREVVCADSMCSSARASTSRSQGRSSRRRKIRLGWINLNSYLKKTNKKKQHTHTKHSAHANKREHYAKIGPIISWRTLPPVVFSGQAKNTNHDTNKTYTHTPTVIHIARNVDLSNHLQDAHRLIVVPVVQNEPHGVALCHLGKGRALK